MKVSDKLKEIIASTAESEGYAVLEITPRREGGRLVLRVIADNEGGITIDECATLNNKLSELMDKENLMDGPYVLEVSSPGLDKKLETDSDFRWALGKKIKVTTYTPVDGDKVFSGVLLGLGDGTIVIEENGVSVEISREKIAGARLNEIDADF
ncbi:MAG: ribosome maturation factor RimP [Candidatus Omnitrophica bacterium]|nr:ribosome maturation factor RimP [Candidatus Omnitrophota bacterium]